MTAMMTIDGNGTSGFLFVLGSFLVVDGITPRDGSKLLLF